jgi:hypothetical protein
MQIAEREISFKDRAHVHYIPRTLKRIKSILLLHSSIPNQALSISKAVTIGQFQVLN